MIQDVFDVGRLGESRSARRGATTPDGRTVFVAARKAVVFARGGFTHDPELRRNFLHAPDYAGCAAVRAGMTSGAVKG